MMVPDYALIGEIMLDIFELPSLLSIPKFKYLHFFFERFFAYGFEFAKECGAKMVTTFKLCSEQVIFTIFLKAHSKIFLCWSLILIPRI